MSILASNGINNLINSSNLCRTGSAKPPHHGDASQVRQISVPFVLRMEKLDKTIEIRSSTTNRPRII